MGRVVMDNKGNKGLCAYETPAVDVIALTAEKSILSGDGVSVTNYRVEKEEEW